MNNLWSSNTPSGFWLCDPNPPDELWDLAIKNALPVLQLPDTISNMDDVLQYILGEGQFGVNPWQLSRVKQLYYHIKPFLSPTLKRAVRRLVASRSKDDFRLGWPIEARYVNFLWEVMRQLLLITGNKSLTFRYFWPDGGRFAFALTHDIETAEGQRHVRHIADIEEQLGFRSSFAFVPESYPVDYELMRELQSRGFEVAVHGLKHDGKDFESYGEFVRRAERINHYLEVFNSKSFYAALTLRQPHWMQMLNIDYDRSFFDTDPFEPIPGGVMTIFPYTLGHFIELPYTLVQDYTLAVLLQEQSPRLWLEKVDFIKQYHGMALLVTHPDYLKKQHIERIYVDFLKRMKDLGEYWFALPCEVAHWWRERGNNCHGDTSPHCNAEAVLENGELRIYPPSV